MLPARADVGGALNAGSPASSSAAGSQVSSAWSSASGNSSTTERISSPLLKRAMAGGPGNSSTSFTPAGGSYLRRSNALSYVLLQLTTTPHTTTKHAARMTQ